MEQFPEATTSSAQIINTPKIADLEKELQEANYRISDLRDALRHNLQVLETWEDVSRKMLYPHQHDTVSLTKEAIRKTKSVL